MSVVIVRTIAGAAAEQDALLQGSPMPKLASVAFINHSPVIDAVDIQDMSSIPPEEVSHSLSVDDVAFERVVGSATTIIHAHVATSVVATIKAIGLLLEDGTLWGYAPYRADKGGLNKTTEFGITLLITVNHGAGDSAITISYDPYDSQRMAGIVVDRALESLPDAGTEQRGLMTSQQLHDLDISLKQSEVAMSAVASSKLYHDTEWQLHHLNTAHEIDAITGQSGILLDATVESPFIDLCLPYGVVIGDSISEGHPGLHGSKHLGDDTHRWGQISYNLSKNYGIPIKNHGIGGQTSQQIRDRWDADVLNGAGNGVLPHFVYLHVGINDVYLRDAVDDIKSNYQFFASSCRDNDIRLIMANIGSHIGLSGDKLADAQELNRWLSDEFLESNPDVVLVDYLAWSSNGTLDYGALRPDMFADGVHPSKHGYSVYSQEIIRAIDQRMPLYMQGIELQQERGWTSNFNLSDLTVNNVTHSADANIWLPILNAPSSDPVITVGFEQFPSYYAGLSRAFCLMASRKSSPTPLVSGNRSELAAAAVLIKGVISGGWDHFGVSVDASKLEERGCIELVTTEAIHSLDLELVGSPSLFGNNGGFYVRWNSAVASNGINKWDIVVYDNNNAPVTNIDAYTMQIKGWTHVS